MQITESFELHDTLNPKIWDGNILKSDVEEALIKIVSEYISTSEVITENDVIDVNLVGSNASYNYTEESDLDVHIVVNMENISCDPELVQIACNSEKSSFNKNYDLSIKGIQVELYVEDVKASTESNGIYSLFKKEWIKFPTKIENIDYSKDQNFINELTEYKNRIENILSTSSRAIDIQDEINNLYNMRRESIMTEGEYGFGNQLFKEIRSLGLLDSLKNKKYELSSKELSLESKKLGEHIMKKYRINYLLKEDYHYSIIDSDNPDTAVNDVVNYFTPEDNCKILSVEECNNQGPQEGPDAGLSNLLITSINDEWTTISSYNDLVISARAEGREDIAKIIEDITNEEVNHVGMLQTALKLVSPNVSNVQDGEQEATEIINQENTQEASSI